MPVAVKWAVGTEAAREALLREYAFLRAPGLSECYFIVEARPARASADSRPVMALSSQASAEFLWAQGCCQHTCPSPPHNILPEDSCCEPALGSQAGLHPIAGIVRHQRRFDHAQT